MNVVVDRRAHRRHDASLVVSYRPKDAPSGYDITHARNLSQDGMLLTTAKAFEKGAQLMLQIQSSCTARTSAGDRGGSGFQGGSSKPAL